MKKVLSALLVGLLAVTFIMGVYCYGTSKRYSAWAHFQRIADNFERFPSMEALTTIWTQDFYIDSMGLVKAMDDYDPYTDAELSMMYFNGDINEYWWSHYTLYHHQGNDCYLSDPILFVSLWVAADESGYDGFESNDFSMGCHDKDCEHYVDVGEYHEAKYKTYDGTNEILAFFDEVKGFFLRLGDTFVWIADYVIGIFKAVGTLLPWNGLVART